MLVRVEFDSCSPPAGTVTGPSARPERFAGWLGLIRSLAEVVDAVPEPSPGGAGNAAEGPSWGNTAPPGR